MKTATRKLRSPWKWHGGKSYLCKRFIDLFPEHGTYLEPFAGGLSTLLNKPKCGREIASDLNFNLMYTWRILQTFGREVASRLRDLPYARETFDWSLADASGHPAKFACRLLVRNRMSRGGLGKDFAWSDRLRGKRRPGGPVPGDVNAWETFVNNDLPRVIERIGDVDFRTADAMSVIKEHADDRDALVFADPPYLHETRTHTKAYDYEMSRHDHAELLDVLIGCRCKVFLCGYRSDLYDYMLAGWTRHEFSMPNHSGQGKSKQRRVECLWENRP